MALDHTGGLIRRRWCTGVNGWGESERPHRINEAVRQVVAETGIVRVRRKRAVDSTILADAVATPDTITQLIAAIRRVGRVVPGAAEVITVVCTGHDYRRPGKPVIEWDEPGAQDTLVSALVNDATALLAVFAGVDPGGWGERAQGALALLALVAGRDVEPAEGSDGTDGRWRIARRVAPDRVISTVDPDARHTRIAGGAPGWVSGACGGGTGDGDHHRRGADRRPPGRRIPIRAWRGSSCPPRTTRGSGTAIPLTARGISRGAIDDAGGQAVINPKPVRAPVEGGFTGDDVTVDDFTVDEQAGTVGCPAGHTRPISRTRIAGFGALRA
jgi:hypothetical protein